MPLMWDANCPYLTDNLALCNMNRGSVWLIVAEVVREWFRHSEVEEQNICLKIGLVSCFAFLLLESSPPFPCCLP